jgi:uncharacterized protein (TIGR04255 family)
VEVVCEIRFPWNLAVDCRRHEFHQAIRDPYRAIYAPDAEPGPPLVTRPYRFENPDTAAGVMVAVDKFAYYEQRYESHKKFTAEFLRLTAVFSEIFGLDTLDRVGWRYINIIPFTRESGILPLRRLLNLGVTGPTGVSGDFENVSIVLISKVARGSITTKLQSLIRPDKQEAFLLDFDFGMTEGLRFTNLASYVRDAHDHTRGLFEELITDEYRQYLRGDVV